MLNFKEEFLDCAKLLNYKITNNFIKDSLEMFTLLYENDRLLMNKEYWKEYSKILQKLFSLIEIDISGDMREDIQVMTTTDLSTTFINLLKSLFDFYDLVK
jgi:hypothetical protein